MPEAHSRDVCCCRGGFLFGCCAPVSMKIKEAVGQSKNGPAPNDANIVNGGDVKGGSIQYEDK